MKYLGQFAILMSIIFLGEGLHSLLPFPIPTSIYGLVLLFLALLTGIVKLKWVEETADFLIAIMPITFVPASVMLIEDWPILKPFLLPLLVMCVISTVVIFSVSGRVTQAVIRRRKRQQEEHHA